MTDRMSLDADDSIQLNKGNNSIKNAKWPNLLQLLITISKVYYVSTTVFNKIKECLRTKTKCFVRINLLSDDGDLVNKTHIELLLQ